MTHQKKKKRKKNDIVLLFTRCVKNKTKQKTSKQKKQETHGKLPPNSFLPYIPTQWLHVKEMTDSVEDNEKDLVLLVKNKVQKFTASYKHHIISPFFSKSYNGLCLM